MTPFFDRRKPEGKAYTTTPDTHSMNRLYAVEAAFSVTGGMADHRLRVAPGTMPAVAAAIARELGVQCAAPALDDEHAQAWIKPLVADLKASAGKSLVLVGSRQPAFLHGLALAINQALGSVGEGKPLQLVQTGNQGLGDLAALTADLKAGALDTLILLTPANPVYDAPADLDLPAAVSKAKTVIHLGERTDATAHAATWHVPAAHYLESWSDARSAHGVYTVVQPMILPLYPDCVSELELLLALLSADGKLVNGEGPEGAPSPAYRAVRKTFAELGGQGDAPWKKLLRDGFLAGSAYPAATAPAGPLPAAPNVPAGTLEVIFAADASVFDGRWIDNGWLQETPDPISKLTWDNAALVAPKTAKSLGIYDQLIAPEPVSKVLGVEGKYADAGPDGEGENRKQPMIAVTVNGKTLEIPVLISFGQAENTLVIPLGYGQGFDADDELGRGPLNASHVGLVGVNRGFNAYPLRTSATTYFATGASAKLVEDKRYPVALTQEHHAMYGRALAREVSTFDDAVKGSFNAQLANVRKQGNDSHAPPNVYLYKPENRQGAPLINDPLHQWGMSIDLSACMGCNACSIACQAENNIPIVGKQQVAKGREMHWIRMDRYYAAQEFALDSHGNRIKDKNTGEYVKTPDWVRDNPAFVPQPVACVHCESAPCEVVCPVNATVHTEDGLNAMAYNRCIGTRYCANNCPYKARRFNFFDYNKRNPLIKHNLYRGPLGEKAVGEPDHLQKNPNVTVRMRGVMEKCTYCVQRVQNGKIRHKVKMAQAGRPGDVVVPDGTIKVACEQTCPVGAIVFGNILDKDSAVSRAKAREQDYAVLGYLNVRPRTTYSGKLRNPNPRMPDFQPLPFSRVEYSRKNEPAAHGDHGAHGHGHGAAPATPSHGGKS